MYQQQTTPNLTVTIGSSARVAAATAISDDPASPANASIVPGIPDRAPAVANKPKAAPVELTEGYVPLGYQAGNNFIWSTQRRCVVCLDGNAVTTVTLETHGGTSWLFSTYGEKTENGGTKLNLARARSELISACQRAGYYNSDRVLGTGVWYADLDGVRTLVCNSGSTIFDASGNPVARAGRGAVFAEGLDNGMRAGGAEATDADVRELSDLIDSWSWLNRSDAALALGWIAIAPFSGALDRRPIFALHAPPRSGKTTLLEAIESLYGTGRLSLIGSDSSASGITQKLGASSVPVLLDEIFAGLNASKRDTDRVKTLQALLRVAFAASGDGIAKGGADGHSREYSARFCSLIASRTFPQMSDEDRSRMIYCRLGHRDSTVRKNRLLARRQELLPALGARVRQRMFSNWSAFEATRGNVAEILICEMGLDDRFTETIGQAIAGWYVLMTGKAADLAVARTVVSQFNLRPHVERMTGDSDPRDCADWLMGAVPAGGTVTIGELMRLAADGSKAAQATLETVGVKLAGDVVQICSSNGYEGIRKVFADSRWAGGTWANILEQATGARTANPRFGGNTKAAVAIPLAWMFDEPTQSDLGL